jgi:tRNA(adenine34) deaminase
MTQDVDHEMMCLALDEARLAERQGEVPVGAVLVSEGRVIASGHNRQIASSDPSAHAEIVVLREAAKVQQNYRLPGSTLYVTLEPCAMCAGALVHARVERLVYAASEPRAGAIRSRMALLAAPYLNHRVAVTEGVCSEDSAALLRAFFSARR